MIFTLLMTLWRKKLFKTLGYKPNPPFRKKFQKLSKIFCKNRSAYSRLNTVINRTIQQKLLLMLCNFIAPAGFWPLGQNPRRHPRSPRVYTYKDKDISWKSKKCVCNGLSILDLTKLGTHGGLGWTRGNLDLLICVFVWDFGYVILGYVILYPVSFVFFVFLF